MEEAEPEKGTEKGKKEKNLFLPHMKQTPLSEYWGSCVSKEGMAKSEK